MGNNLPWWHAVFMTNGLSHHINQLIHLTTPRMMAHWNLWLQRHGFTS